MEKEYWVLYGVDAGDDYLKLLSSEEFETVKEAIEKFSSSECVFCDIPDLSRIKHYKNNITYLAKELIEKRELQVSGNNFVVVGEDDEDLLDFTNDDKSKDIINNLLKNAEFIKNLTVEFKYKFRILDSEIYLFRLVVAE